MLCERCKKREATVFYTEIINGVKKSVALCESCDAEAEASGDYGKFSFEVSLKGEPLGDINSLFGSLFGIPQYQKRPAEAKKCTLCASTFADLVREGKAGCPECYKVFADELAPTISKIHGAAIHTGNVPERYREGLEKKNLIAETEKELKRAVEAEEYERAAELRDKLRALKSTDANA